MKEAGTLSEYFASGQAAVAVNLKVTGEINGDDITFIHTRMHSLETLDLSKVHIVGGEFLCGQHKNYYTCLPDELSAHFLHIGRLKRVILPAGIKNIVISQFTTFEFGACADTSEFTRLSGAFSFDLEHIEVPAENSYYSSYDGILYNKEQTELLKCPFMHSDEIDFPLTLRVIHANAFRECKNITDIEIPEGVVTIGDCAFYACEKLKSAGVPSTVRDFGADVFSHSYKMRDLNMMLRTPPELEVNRGSSIHKITLTVPAGSRDAYEQAPFWVNFKRIVEV